MKALAKERDRRYETATGFAKDLNRFLQKRAVAARPPSRAYLFRRFVQRNRVGVAFVSVLAIAVVVGAIGTSVGLVRAKKETAKAAAINTFLLEMLQGVNPDKAQGREVTVREMLDAAAEEVGQGLTSEPEVESDVRQTIGSIYSKLGRYEDADPHIQRVYDLRREIYGRDDARTLDALNLLAINLFRARDHDRAQEMFAEQLGCADACWATSTRTR